MNYRINTKALLFVGILVIAAVGLFAYTLVHAPSSQNVEQPSETAPIEDAALDTRITAKHQYKEGIHTIVGFMEVPTPCHRIIAEPFFLEDSTVVEVRLSSFLEGEECSGEPISVPFNVTFEAPEDVSIQALWDGKAVQFNLIPVGPDEVLTDEIYIKG